MKFYTVENKGTSQWYRVMEDGAQIIEVEFRSVGLAGNYDVGRLRHLFDTHPEVAMSMMHGTLTPSALEKYLENNGYPLFGQVKDQPDDQTKVFDKIRKLLRLARDTSGDVGEAAAANSKVLELMKKHNITNAQIAAIQKSL